MSLSSARRRDEDFASRMRKATM
eukprot:COSAG01_NODE_58146_length_307_cov_18.899038_1_plen_22_part_10